MRSEKIGIIGCSGFIGRELAASLSVEYEVLGFSPRSRSVDSKNVREVKDINLLFEESDFVLNCARRHELGDELGVYQKFESELFEAISELKTKVFFIDINSLSSFGTIYNLYKDGHLFINECGPTSQRDEYGSLSEDFSSRIKPLALKSESFSFATLHLATVISQGELPRRGILKLMDLLPGVVITPLVMGRDCKVPILRVSFLVTVIKRILRNHDDIDSESFILTENLSHHDLAREFFPKKCFFPIPIPNIFFKIASFLLPSKIWSIAAEVSGLIEYSNLKIKKLTLS